MGWAFSMLFPTKYRLWIHGLGRWDMDEPSLRQNRDEISNLGIPSSMHNVGDDPAW